MSESDFDTLVTKEWETYLTNQALLNIKELFSGVAFKTFELSLVGKSSHEISEMLQITQASVRTLKNRVRIRLIKEIKLLRDYLEF